MAGAAKTERQDEIRQQIKDGCRERARVMASGELEQLRERIDHPEDIVAHAIAL